jgi:phosphoribosyl 1,2-cyclic phosphodiesterase
MFRFESFGSGSSGNLYYVESDNGAILIDAGLGIRKIRKYFREYGIKMCNIKGILVTHNHMDHVMSVGILNKKDGFPVYLTQKVFEGIVENPAITNKPVKENTFFVNKLKPFNIAGFDVCAFDVPHDSKDNVGYFISHYGTSLCLVTDCGMLTDTIDGFIAQADYLILESNYDELLLERGPYPQKLKQRIRGGNGHLSNPLAASVIFKHQSHLRHVWLCHLSEKNNTPECALQTVRNALAYNGKCPVETLDRTNPSKMFDLE